jgi:hypothetical protein
MSQASDLGVLRAPGAPFAPGLAASMLQRRIDVACRAWQRRCRGELAVGRTGRLVAEVCRARWCAGAPGHLACCLTGRCCGAVRRLSGREAGELDDRRLGRRRRSARVRRGQWLNHPDSSWTPPPRSATTSAESRRAGEPDSPGRKGQLAQRAARMRMPGFAAPEGALRVAPDRSFGAPDAADQESGPRRSGRSASRSKIAAVGPRNTSSPAAAYRTCVLTEQRREFLQFRGRASVRGFTVAGHDRTGGTGQLSGVP